uniref:Cytochrome c oxidase subunit 2 n=1 Tax=Schistosoma haematobium TaxID=6185 RepID=Q9MEU5_SCHHA|nr:cytochrome c oxidase subunit II [Schistosoma haematobium]AAZ57315.1 cytochrome c oxidase subunit II [Schistosoma haematobium]CAB97517.1 putative cytochrome oxidase subunit II [Schistosoma haematobium]
MINYNVLVYYDLVLYVLSLSWYIPLWCIVVLLVQIIESKDVSIVLPSEACLLEFIWTLVPTLLIVVLCFYKLNYLAYYSNGSFFTPIKVVGHQWYWSYELPNGTEYDSFITDIINSVNKPLRLYYGMSYSLLVTSADVIHSFSIPDFSLKIDAVPGRINCINLFTDRLGVFSGYCTELCGVGHSYMPIVIEVILFNNI